MQINATLDVDVVALETADTVTVMLDLTAPEAPVTDRPACCVVAVIDRSGSMGGGRLDAAKRGLLSIIDRMRPTDRLGVVVFDGQAQLIVPAEEMSAAHRQRAQSVIAAVQPGGNTDLGGGLLRGLQEARRAATETGATVIVLSDGHANAGITDPTSLHDLARSARADLITTSTIGVGLGFDETLLATIALGGAGNAAFAEHADAAAGAIADEVDGLLSKSVQAASALLVPSEHVTAVSILSDVPSIPMAGGINIDLGDMYSAEARRLLLQINVPGRGDLGLLQIAEITLRYVTVPELIEHTVTLPINVNVVPGDEAAGRVRAPEVVQERLLLEVQQSKRASEDAMRRGDIDEARSFLGAAMAMLDTAPLSDDALEEERQWITLTQANLEEWDHEYTTKRMSMDSFKKSAGRRNRSQGGELGFDDEY